jgi:hypothetical protein
MEEREWKRVRHPSIFFFCFAVCLQECMYLYVVTAHLGTHVTRLLRGRHPNCVITAAESTLVAAPTLRVQAVVGRFFIGDVQRPSKYRHTQSCYARGGGLICRHFSGSLHCGSVDMHDFFFLSAVLFLRENNLKFIY